MLNDPDFRKNLLVSIVTSVLVLIFIEPLLKLSANGIMWLGANVSAYFTKSVYTSAALGLREKFSFINLVLFSAVLIGAMLGSATISIRRSHPKAAAREGSSKVVRILTMLNLIIFLVLISYSMAKNFIELQLNTSFNQRMVVLAAKIPDQKIKELRANWALMESREDYEALNTEINRIAKELNTRLPVALWE
jgi:hypothetical protein